MTSSRSIHARPMLAKLMCCRCVVELLRCESVPLCQREEEKETRSTAMCMAVDEVAAKALIEC